MKYLQIFELFKKNKEEEFKGKKETYRFSNIHDDKGIRRGDCKDCGEKGVDITEHSNTCDKVTE